MASVFNKLKKLSEEERSELKEKFADVSTTIKCLCCFSICILRGELLC